MFMNRWRVGSISMGLILMAVGVIMLVSLITKIDMLVTITTLWPIIMICLGIEILLFLFIKKGDDTKIKYDILSILFIGFILVISVIFYAATSIMSALFDSREDVRDAFRIFNDTVYSEFSVELEGTDELVAFHGVNSLKVLSTTEKNIRVDYNISIAVNSSSREYAESMLDKLVKFEMGERAYMLPGTHIFTHNLRTGYSFVNCVIYLPPGKMLDMSQFRGHFEYDSTIEEQIIRHRM